MQREKTTPSLFSLARVEYFLFSNVFLHQSMRDLSFTRRDASFPTETFILEGDDACTPPSVDRGEHTHLYLSYERLRSNREISLQFFSCRSAQHSNCQRREQFSFVRRNRPDWARDRESKHKQLEAGCSPFCLCTFTGQKKARERP